jgi:hypothetical protein
MPSAHEAWERATAGEQVIGWKVDPAQRAELLARFIPKYANAIADHVTLKSRVGEESALPDETEGTIVGRSDDGLGVEAMVVRIAGMTSRPGGGTYHITWSLEPGREAKESNDGIAARGFEPVEPVDVRLQPARFPRS